MQVLTRAWQLLLKGLREVKDSPRPLAAADMVLVRIGFAADLPTPDEALRKLAAMTSGEAQEGSRPRDAGGGAREPAAIANSAIAVARAPHPEAAGPSIALSRFEDVVALAGRKRDIQMKLALERDVRLVRFEQGRIEFSRVPGASPQLAQTLARRLQEWTGSRWMVAISSAPGSPSLKEREDAKAGETLSGAHAEPLVRSVLAAFPGAEITGVRACEPAPRAMPSAGTDGETNDEIGFNDGTEDEL
ncbi:MAG: DNA polymerase III subunit gamma/tau, partial [Methylocella sp.]